MCSMTVPFEHCATILRGEEPLESQPNQHEVFVGAIVDISAIAEELAAKISGLVADVFASNS